MRFFGFDDAGGLGGGCFFNSGRAGIGGGVRCESGREGTMGFDSPVGRARCGNGGGAL